MSEDVDLEAVMRRVKKLLAIAQDERANPAEAAAAAMQAEKVMRKFQIDHIDLMRSEFAKASNFDYVDCVVRMKMHNPLPPKLVPFWAQHIGVAVAILNDCQAQQRLTEQGKVLRFMGFKSDAQVSGWTFDYLVRQVIENCRAYQAEATRTKLQSNSYREGFVASLCNQLSKLKQEKDAAQASVSSGRELVLLKASAVAEHFGEVRYRESDKKISDPFAFSAGLKDGKKVDASRRAIGAEESETQLMIGQ